MSQIEIRRALFADMADIHELVRELALYEKAPEKVITTVESYRADFASGAFDAFLALVDGKIQGMALFCKMFSTWRGRMLYLEDFIVREAYRKSGLGKLLFEAFLEEARRQDVALVKWQVLEWNELALRFYEKYEVAFDKEWVDCKIYFK